MNRVDLIGRIGNDLKIQENNGKKILNMNIATQEYFKDDPDWHRAVAYDKKAEILAKNLKKGDKVRLEGRLETKKYVKGDQTHYNTTVQVQNFEFL